MIVSHDATISGCHKRAQDVEDKRVAELEEALRELVSIVKIHQRATKNNFAWAELDMAKEALEASEG